MTQEELDQFINGREIYRKSDCTIFKVSHVEPMFETIYFFDPLSIRRGYVSYDDFKKDYIFVDDLLPVIPTKVLTCECGVDKYGAGNHSDYCPKYERG